MSTRIVRYKIPSVVSAAWAKGFGDITTSNTSSDRGNCVTTDAQGNIYWAGWFRGTIDLGGTVTERLTAVSTDMFVAKFDSSGAHIWSKRFGAPSEFEFITIVLGSDNNIYIGSRVTGGSLIKLNAAGDTQWIKGPSVGFNRIAIDSENNVVGTGLVAAPFSSPIDFGNGFTLYAQSNYRDVFYCKYNSDGDCQWAKRFGNSGEWEESFGICVDPTDNSIFVGGWSLYDIYLAGDATTTNMPLETPHYYKQFRFGSRFGFLGKFDSNGTIIWSKAMGLGISSDPLQMFTRIECMAIDSDGNPIIGGTYNYRTNFGAGTYDGSGAVDRNGWVAKYDGSNGNLIWVQPINGNQFLAVLGVASGPQNSVIAVGYYYGVYNFGGASLSNPHSVPNHDIFIAKYTSAGALVVPSLREFGSDPLSERANGVAIDGAYAIMTGYFQGTVNFNGTTLTSKGNLDAFLMRLLH